MSGIKSRISLKQQLFPLQLVGLLYPPNWEQSWWKKKLYDMFTLAIAILNPSLGILLLCYLKDHIDDLFTITAVLFPVLCIVSVFINYMYFMINKPKLLKLIDRIETEFIFHIERVGSPERMEAILSERSQNSKRITYAMLSMYTFSMTFWAIFPWLLGYIDYFTKSEEELANIEIEKYFGMLIFLPENVNKSPIYELLQFYHVMGVYSTVTNITACYMIMFILIYHTATLFRLICAAFEDLDYFENKLRSEYELNVDYIRFPYESLNNGEGKKHDFVQPPTKERGEQFDGNTYEDHADTFRSTNDNKFKPSVTDPNDFNPKVTEEYQTRLHDYLVHCVEFHQAVISYTDDLNDLISPMVFTFFIFTEAMLCLSAFQLVLVCELILMLVLSSHTHKGLGRNLTVYKFTAKYMSCAVKQSVFNTRWYCQSKSINKLLQMVMIRAQQPVTIRAGKFYVATLETFSDICHKVYAYLTLLRQMYDD